MVIQILLHWGGRLLIFAANRLITQGFRIYCCGPCQHSAHAAAAAVVSVTAVVLRYTIDEFSHVLRLLFRMCARAQQKAV